MAAAAAVEVSRDERLMSRSFIKEKRTAVERQQNVVVSVAEVLLADVRAINNHL